MTEPDDDHGIDFGDEIIEEGQDRLYDYWSKIGAVEDDVIAPIFGSMLLGGANWPNAREQWRIIRCKRSLILATDGLSTAYTDDDGVDRQGFGCELFIETPDLVGRGHDRIADSFEFSLLEAVTNEVAANGGFGALFDTRVAASIEFPYENEIDAKWLSNGDRLVALLSTDTPGRPNTVQMPIAPIRMIAVTLLAADEAALAVADQHAQIIERRRALSPEYWHWTSLRRPIAQFGRRRFWFF